MFHTTEITFTKPNVIDWFLQIFVGILFVVFNFVKKKSLQPNMLWLTHPPVDSFMNNFQMLPKSNPMSVISCVSVRFEKFYVNFSATIMQPYWRPTAVTWCREKTRILNVLVSKLVSVQSDWWIRWNIGRARTHYVLSLSPRTGLVDSHILLETVCELDGEESRS